MMSDLRVNVPDMRPRMLHRHELAEIGGIEGPGVDDLIAVGIDHLDGLARLHFGGFATTRRNCLDVSHGFVSFQNSILG
jgi:hypothetical protein